MKRFCLFIIIILLISSCTKEENPNPSNYNMSPSEKYGQKKNRPSTSGNVGDSGSGSSSATNGRYTKYQIYSKHAKLVANADYKKKRIAHFAKTAQEEYEKFGIPASVKLAQFILETGGDSKLATKYHNYFGIQCKTEKFGEIDCKPHPTDASRGNYAVYSSAWQSWRAHSKFLQRKYYSYIPTKCGDDALCWFKELQKKYCPEPDYTKGLTAVYKTYNLAKYDKEIKRIKKTKSHKKTASKKINKKPSGKMAVNSSYVWLLNPSHGKDTPGKRKKFKKKLKNGKRTVYEYQLNRAIVNRVVKRCDDLGLNYRLIIKSSDNKKDVSLKERVKRANKHHKQLGNTILLTVDHNATRFDNSNFASIAEAYSKKAASGMESFHHRNNLQMKHFLQVLKKNVEKRLPNWHKRGVKSKGFYTIRKTDMPACILECGFFDNYKEANFLISDKYQYAMSEAIVETMAYFSGVEYVKVGVLTKF